LKTLPLPPLTAAGSRRRYFPFCRHFCFQVQQCLLFLKWVFFFPSCCPFSLVLFLFFPSILVLILFFFLVLLLFSNNLLLLIVFFIIFFYELLASYFTLGLMVILVWNLRRMHGSLTI
jgi:hypothetical protein